MLHDLVRFSFVHAIKMMNTDTGTIGESNGNVCENVKTVCTDDYDWDTYKIIG